MAKRLATVILNTMSTCMLTFQYSINGPEEKILTKMTISVKAAAPLERTLRKAVTGVGAPS